MKRYTRRRWRTLFRKLKKEEMAEGEKMFETLKEAVDTPRRRKKPEASSEVKNIETITLY